jgi:hypothetical protein
MLSLLFNFVKFSAVFLCFVSHYGMLAFDYIICKIFFSLFYFNINLSPNSTIGDESRETQEMVLIEVLFCSCLDLIMLVDMVV